MNVPKSEFGARPLPRLVMNAMALALVGALSACATKGTTGAAGVGSAPGSKSSAAASQGKNANGTSGGAAAAAARNGASVGAGSSGGVSSDPFESLVTRNSAADQDHLADSSVNRADVAGGAAAADPVQEAIARDQARRDREAAGAKGGAGAGSSAGSSAGGAGAGTGSSAGSSAGGAGGTAGTGGGQGTAGVDRYQEGYDPATYDPVAEALAREQQRRDAAGGSHKGGSQTSDLAANGGPGGSKGKGTSAGAGDAESDPVKRALARAESQAGAGAGSSGGQGGADGSRSAAGPNGGRSGAGAAGTAGHPSAARNGAGVPGDDSPVSEALRRAEAAAAAARERERQEAEARRGRVETAANRVLIDQDERLQTLDGMLPMALNMDEQGLFDFDRYQLRDDVKRSLDDLAEKLKSAAYDKLHILGFTDRIGTEDYNRRLSEKRAWAVAGYLMNKGVPPHKLRVVGRGEEGSVVGAEQCEGLSREEMIECLQKDRRVEIAATVKEYQLDVR